MNEIPTAPNPEQAASGQSRGELDELKAWLHWMQQAAEAGGTLSQLAVLELRLAFADSKRLLLMGLAMVPVIVLMWMGFTVLLAWLAYQQSLSVTFGLCVFLAQQVLALVIMIRACKGYKKSLSLPATRSHIQAFVEGTQRGAPTTDR